MCFKLDEMAGALAEDPFPLHEWVSGAWQRKWFSQNALGKWFSQNVLQAAGESLCLGHEADKSPSVAKAWAVT